MISAHALVSSGIPMTRATIQARRGTGAGAIPSALSAHWVGVGVDFMSLILPLRATLQQWRRTKNREVGEPIEEMVRDRAL